MKVSGVSWRGPHRGPGSLEDLILSLDTASLVKTLEKQTKHCPIGFLSVQSINGKRGNYCLIKKDISLTLTFFPSKQFDKIKGQSFLKLLVHDSSAAFNLFKDFLEDECFAAEWDKTLSIQYEHRNCCVAVFRLNDGAFYKTVCWVCV